MSALASSAQLAQSPDDHMDAVIHVQAPPMPLPPPLPPNPRSYEELAAELAVARAELCSLRAQLARHVACPACRGNADGAYITQSAAIAGAAMAASASRRPGGLDDKENGRDGARRCRQVEDGGSPVSAAAFGGAPSKQRQADAETCGRASSPHGDSKEILSHCSDISGSHKGDLSCSVHSSDHKKVVSRGSKTAGSRAFGGAVTKIKSSSAKSRKNRSAAGNPKIPGQSRYWTPDEHKLFLEALNKYGHKDLKAISAWVGSRNMTQVRTHSQKYFMRLMREAKRQNPVEAVAADAGASGSVCNSSANEVDATEIVKSTFASDPLDTDTHMVSPDVHDASVPEAEEVLHVVEHRDVSPGEDSLPKHLDNDKYSVPSTCGMTLLCLVGEDTLPV